MGNQFGSIDRFASANPKNHIRLVTVNGFAQ
jgi:hypothetical protein